MTAAVVRFARLTTLVVCMLAPVAAYGQYRPLDTEADDSGKGGKPGGYLKAGLAYWQGNVLSEGALTSWNFDLFGAESDLTSANVEIEAYLGRHLIVPGFTIGYRKDAIRTREAGHLVYGALFAAADLKLLMIKAGGGGEWGVPSMAFDQTVFTTLADGTVRYRHSYPTRNAQVPVGTRSNGVLYPFAVLSVVTRPGPFLLEVGMRVNLVGFSFDDYEVRPGDRVTRTFTERRVAMPLLFANVGFKLF
jgi:hypothetical protein